MDVGEEVVVGEVVVGDRIVRDEAVSSRAERSPKTISPFSRTGLKECGFGGLLSRPAVHAASRDGEDRSSSAVLRHRLGSFPQTAARRVVTRRGVAGGGGGARVDVPLVLMLIHVGKEPPL